MKLPLKTHNKTQKKEYKMSKQIPIAEVKKLPITRSFKITDVPEIRLVRSTSARFENASNIVE